MALEMKHKKFCDKFHTDTSSYVTICNGDVLVSQKLHSEKGFKLKKVVMWQVVSSAPVGNYVTNAVSYVKLRIDVSS